MFPSFDRRFDCLIAAYFQIMLGELREPAVKKTKGHPYFTPELAYILASCEERIPLVNLGLEVSQICFCVNALGSGGACCL